MFEFLDDQTLTAAQILPHSVYLNSKTLEFTPGDRPAGLTGYPKICLISP